MLEKSIKITKYLKKKEKKEYWKDNILSTLYTNYWLFVGHENKKGLHESSTKSQQ